MENYKEQIIKNLGSINEDGMRFLAEMSRFAVANKEYNINTTAEELIELKKEEEKKFKEQEEKNIQFEISRKEHEKIPLYERNDTMKMLGQAKCDHVIDGGIACNDFDNLREAYKYRYFNDSFGVFVDSFNLGVIWGKRIERARKSGVLL